MTFFLLMNVASADEVLTMDDFENLRNGLPQDKGNMPNSGLIEMSGILITLPDKNICQMIHLLKIGKKIKLTQSSSLKMLTYLRDKDPHMKILAYVSLSQHLRASGKLDHGGNVYALAYAAHPAVGPLFKDQKRIKQGETIAIDKLLSSYAKLYFKPK